MEWTANGHMWWLSLTDGRAPFQDDLTYRDGIDPETFRMDTLSRKDALVTAAEEIYDKMS